MKDYQITNFANVELSNANMDSLSTPQAQTARIAYLDAHIQDFEINLMSEIRGEGGLLLYQELKQTCVQVLDEIKRAYRKKKNDPKAIFLLEQILGHTENLFNQRRSITMHQPQDLQNIKYLTQHLTGHASPALRRIGILFLLIGLIIAVTSLAMLSLAMMSTGIGFFIGLAIIITGIIALWVSREKSVAKSASLLLDSIQKVQETLDFYDSFIQPLLDENDKGTFRNALEAELNRGVSANLLKGALAAARQSHDMEATLISSNTYQNKKYLPLFQRLADICNVAAFNNQWLETRMPPESLEINYEGLMKHSKMTRYTTWMTLWKTCPAISYFNNEVAGILDKDENTKFLLKAGLQKLIKHGTSPEDLKLALAWAVRCYELGLIASGDNTENVTQLFKRIATICGKADLADEHKLANEPS